MTFDIRSPYEKLRGMLGHREACVIGCTALTTRLSIWFAARLLTLTHNWFRTSSGPVDIYGTWPSAGFQKYLHRGSSGTFRLCEVYHITGFGCSCL